MKKNVHCFLLAVHSTSIGAQTVQKLLDNPRIQSFLADHSKVQRTESTNPIVGKPRLIEMFCCLVLLEVPADWSLSLLLIIWSNLEKATKKKI